MFRTIWVHLGPFLPYNTQCQTGQLVQKFVPQSRIGIFHNERNRSTPLDSKLFFSCFLYYLGAFGTVCCLPILCAKRIKLVQKFVPRSRVGIFYTNAPNPSHWTLNYCFGAFRTIWVHSGRLVALRNSVQNEPS